MAKTISQRISLEGSEDIRKKLEELGKTGADAFKQIQDAAKKPITDPAQIDKTRQAISDLVQASQRLGQQYQALTANAQQFGTVGAQAGQQAAAGLNQANQAAAQTGRTLQQVSQQTSTGLISSANAFRIAVVGIVAAITAVTSALTKGAAETASKVSDQADKLKTSIPVWNELRKQISAADGDIDDFVKAGEKIGKMLDDAAGGAVKLGGATVTLQKFGENVVTIYGGVAKGSAQANAAAQKLVDTLVSGGAPINAIKAILDGIATGDRVATMKAFAAAIAGMTDETRKAALGAAIFGADWAKMIEILTTAKSEADKSKEAIRQLSAETVKQGKEVSKAWDDVGEAFRALKDRIGSFFFAGSLAKAQWLVEMIDGANKLLQIWVKLDDEAKDGFLAKLKAGTPAETLFKVLIALGQQLAGLWNNVLVPAGRQLWAIMQQIAESLGGITKASQVAAFFVTLTAAVVGLSIALGALNLLLGPLLALFSPLGAVLLAVGAAAVVFWDQIVAGAQAAAALVPNSIALMQQAFRRLLVGDFKGFWRDFSEAAVAAFQTIKQAIFQQFPALQQLSDGIVQFGKDLPGAIMLIVDAFIALGNAADFIAKRINAVFGTDLNATSLAAIVIIGQMTGGFQLLATAIGVVSGALTAFVAVVALVGTTFGTAAAAIVAGLALIPIALAAIILFWPQISATAIAVWNAIKARWDEIVAGITADVNNLVAVFQAVWTSFSDFAMAAFDKVTSGVTAVIGAITNAINALLQLLGLGSQVGQGEAIANSAAPGAFAGGGRVGGRGTGTSDSNLAWVSRGEHIMPARAVRQPGVLAFLEALRRSGGNLSRVLDRMGHFAMGGLVTAPAFAGGGMSNVTIQFPGLPAIGGLRAPSDVVEELRKAAAMAQVRSGGRKPSRYS